MGKISNFVREKVEAWRQARRFSAQNCLNRQYELRIREERKEKEERQRRIDEIIEEIENKIHFVVSQSCTQQIVLFQIVDGEKPLFEEVKQHFTSAGFDSYFEEIGKNNVEVLVISWM